MADRFPWAPMDRSTCQIWKGDRFGRRWLPLAIFDPSWPYHPQILDGPPEANEVWIRGPEDIVNEKWDGKTVIDVAAANECKIGEWLLVQVWDES